MAAFAGELTYNAAQLQPDLQTRIDKISYAPVLWPFERRYRLILPVTMANQAIAFNMRDDWVDLAVATLQQALLVDHSAADIMGYLMSFLLERNKDSDAKQVYKHFKLVAKASALASIDRNRP